jgi:hypothetical protein
MALRFRYRHVHATLYSHIRGELIERGWGDSSLAAGDPLNAAVNFGTTPVTYVDIQPDEAGQQIAGNTVAVTLGDEPGNVDWEMGSSLRLVEYPLYVDIYGVNQSIAQSIGADIRDLLDDQYLPVKDFIQRPPTDTDEQIELLHEDIQIRRPQASLGATDFKRYWRVVRAIARVYYTA